MADNIFDVLSSAEQIASNYSKYADKFKNSNEELVNSETFLNLLVAEMTHQDPLEPTSNTEFITQMAQMTQLQYMQDSSKYSMATYASSLVGKTATASKMDGGNLITKTGVVSDVTKSGDSYTVTIDGVAFDLAKITAVSETNTDGTGSQGAISTGNQLGDMISRASLMIGMQATVSATTESGTAIDSGIIEAIQVKNGEINAVINGIAYKLSDIVEVSYANISADGGEGESTGGTQPEETENTVDAANAAAQAGSDTPQEVVGGAVPDDEDADDLEDLEFNEQDEV